MRILLLLIAITGFTSQASALDFKCDDSYRVDKGTDLNSGGVLDRMLNCFGRPYSRVFTDTCDLSNQ